VLGAEKVVWFPGDRRCGHCSGQYAVPWMWGTVGIMYDADKAKAILGDAPIASLDVIFNKDVAAKFEKCGISVLDSWQDILPMVARYLGQPQLSADPANLNAVISKLAEIKPLLRRIATSGYYEQLADGELCLAIGYSGDAMIARASKSNACILRRSCGLFPVRGRSSRPVNDRCCAAPVAAGPVSR